MKVGVCGGCVGLDGKDGGKENWKNSLALRNGMKYFEYFLKIKHSYLIEIIFFIDNGKDAETPAGGAVGTSTY